MTDGSKPMFDPEARYAALDERVLNLGRQFNALEHSTREGFGAINSRLDVMSRDMSAGQKTQWPLIWAAMGVCMTILTTLGALVYIPIRTDAAETKASLVDLRKDMQATISDVTTNTVSRQEMDQRAARGLEDRTRTDAAVAFLRDSSVPRPEYDERWRGADQRFADLQRQLDALDNRYGETFSLRDSYAEMRADQRALRDEVARLQAERTRAGMP